MSMVKRSIAAILLCCTPFFVSAQESPTFLYRIPPLAAAAGGSAIAIEGIVLLSTSTVDPRYGAICTTAGALQILSDAFAVAARVTADPERRQSLRILHWAGLGATAVCIGIYPLIEGVNGPGISYGRMILQAGCIIAFDTIWSFFGWE
jgi:hypothetical protein